MSRQAKGHVSSARERSSNEAVAQPQHVGEDDMLATAVRKESAFQVEESEQDFDFEVTEELLTLAGDLDGLGDQIRSGNIPNSLLADLFHAESPEED